ncbi:MAG: hypothetical protein QM498_01845 [Desulfobacterium sp.]
MTDPMININRSDMAAVESMLSDVKNGAVKAMVTAINATVSTTKVQVKKRIGQKANLSAARINKNLSIVKANYSKISGKLVASGEPIGLIEFKTKRKNKNGVWIKIWKDASATMVKHSFVANATGNDHVFWRDYDGPRKPISPGRKYGAIPKKFRLPVVKLTGPRIEDVFARTDILLPAQDDAGDLLVVNLGKKVDDILRRHNG